MTFNPADYEKVQEASREIFHKFCKSFLEKDMNQFIELFDDNALFEFPYAPKGFTQKLEGKAAIYEYVKDFPQRFDITRFSEPTFHFAMNPNIMIVEFEIEEAQVLTTGKPYLQKYISVIETRDNKIVHYKDYWNPVIALVALLDAETLQKVLNEQ
ncbi:nuclear transport factor 2 family protein [Paenibacillus apii]|uniref:nuclear transport factor 2 family protein n=1 Tax=Paenibacillus apii TaxID=1850370 RepID=UPI00143BAE3F|nr:nuclear transport factor 2 family protein [Paenibacillus apii]NJJ38667.1 SnoaL-like domain-containing protein [Paenibacillus apii]